MKRVLITGSSGLVGGQSVEFFDSLGWQVVGIDNNMRKEFFGPQADTIWNLNRVYHKTKNFKHMAADIRDEGQMYDIFHRDLKEPKDYQGNFDVIIHCAAQPSHDKAREIPLIDHSVNATGTLMLLEMTRRHCPNAVFIFMSTSKVYGDAPNELPFSEQETRYDYFPKFSQVPDGIWRGYDEKTRIDQSLHSIFGASKLGADIMVQEYARTYGLKTVVFRGGCLTGPGHSPVELHGFLAYLVKCAVSGEKYKIYGYKGKQVRDNIHSYDVVKAFYEAAKNPKPGSVYNLGGGRENSVSILEAIEKIEKITNKKINYEYIDKARLGDHVCWITDTRKFQQDYPDWKITKSIDETLSDMVQRMYWDDHSNDKETLEYPLNSDSVVIDIGGYRGTWSADIIEKYNPHIYIYEPTEEFFKECQRRFSNNKMVLVFKKAVGDSEGVITLAKQGMNTSAYRGQEGQSESTDRILGEPVPEKVNQVDIHEELEYLKYVDLMSLNCEGGEYKILNRLIDTGDIKKIKHVQIQFHNFFPEASQERDKIRERLLLTHEESFCYAFVWESWQIRDDDKI